MATKIRDYAKLAADIREAVGPDNIISAANCATRLRLVLKESPSAEVTQKISEMPAVIKVMENGGQYQIVIGTHAKDVYEEMAKLMGDTAGAEAAEVKQGLFNRIIAAMSAVFAPFIYILAAAGLVQGMLIIITHFAPAFAETGTYAVLSFISWTPFTFMPIMIAVTASKHFKCNTFIGPTTLWTTATATMTAPATVIRKNPSTGTSRSLPPTARPYNPKRQGRSPHKQGKAAFCG